MNSCQLVIFRLGEEEYAIDITYAKEIIRIPKLTKIPNVPDFVEGVFSLRGKVISVIDLKKRFQIQQTEHGNDSRLLILEMDGFLFGIIVDEIAEVLRVEELNIQNLNNETTGISRNSIASITIIGQRLILLLNALELKTEIFKYITTKENE